MGSVITEKLDNPVWYSLSETHKEFSIVYGNSKFYVPDYCAFGGFEDGKDISSEIDDYAKQTDSFFIVGTRPSFSEKIILDSELVCLQMIVQDRINLDSGEEIVNLNKEFDRSVYDLVNFVQPGYFKKKTISMGDYFGIFKDGKLVAVTGERMKMTDYTEVSAVVTHPLYTRRGYAKRLIAHTVNKILDQNKIPYLHVAEKNQGAIRLYETLGFKTRKKISFWNLVRQ